MEKIDFINNQQPALNATNLNKLQDNTEDAIQEVQDVADDLDTNKLDKTSVKNTYSTSATDTYSCNYVNGLETYSTSETRIGTWINDKPIYRIVKSFATATSKTNNSATISISTLNVDNMINIYGSTSGKFMLLGDSQAITWDANNITIYFNNSSAYSVSGYITIEYTKN